MKNLTKDQFVDQLKNTSLFLSDYYNDDNDEDYKNKSFYSALNEIVGILPINVKYQNKLLYDIADINSETYIDNILNNVYGQESQNDLAKLKEEYKELINIGNIDILGAPISFYSSTWDIRRFAIRGKEESLYIYHFSNTLDFQFSTLLRAFILMLLYKYGPHASSTHEKLTITRKFLIVLQNEYGVDTIDDIKCFHIKRYIEEVETKKYHTSVRKKQIIKEFIDSVSLMTNFEFDKDIEIFLTDVDLQRIKAERKRNKTPLLPYSFFKPYENLVCETYLDSKLPKKKTKYIEHFSKGALAIETQLGIRTEELTILHKDCLRKIEVQGETGYYVIYNSTKSSRSKNKPIETGEIPINKYGVKILEKLIDESKKAFPDSDYLLPNIVGDNIRYINNKLCISNARKLGIINRNDSDLFCTNISYSTMGKTSNYRNLWKSYYKGNDNDFLSLPTIKQCRVYVATYFRRMGATNEEIRKIFIHKSELMDGYYVRDDHPVQEDMNYSSSILKQILEEELHILGPKGNDYESKINSYIKNRNIKIKNDLDSIISDICNEMPIRSKLGGFCIKANPNRPCNIDADTDELLCAYNMCPNHCFLYFMLPESYKKCQQYLEIIDYNIKNGFDRSAEKESYLLKNEIEKCLEVEIKETEKEIERRGINSIIQFHPDMLFYINNLNYIKEEIQSWKKTINSLTESK